MTKRVLVLSDRIGSGDAQLGRILMKNFLYSVARNQDAPLSISFMNEGVRLTCEGSESIDDLRLLAEKGVAIKSCGTCLDFLGLADSVAVGGVGAMVDTAGALLGDDDVLTIS